MSARFMPLCILAAGVLLALALVALVVREDRARAAGREVILPVQTVDPRELLTGHYAVLNFVQPVVAGEACPAGTSVRAPATDQGVNSWIVVARHGETDRVLRVASGERIPRLDAGETAVRGRAWCDESPVWREGETPATILRLDVGVTRFHADQATAEAIETSLRGRAPNAFAVLSVDADGQARLKALTVGARRYDLDWF